MGREIRRVPLDFDWPLNKVWEGFVDPNCEHCHECASCGGSGQNPATRKLSQDWYGFGPGGERDRWCYDLTQDEVDALIDARRLCGLAYLHVKGKGWVLCSDLIVTPDMVNDFALGTPYPRNDREKTETWVEVMKEKYGEEIGLKVVNAAFSNPFGHDAINQWICIKVRAKRLGIYGRCADCKGVGEIWDDPKYKHASENWKSSAPPEGSGYQLWETVSEGSPCSPPFAEPGALACWLIRNDRSVTRDTNHEQWVRFIRGPGWAPSAMGRYGGLLQSGVRGMVEDK